MGLLSSSTIQVPKPSSHHPNFSLSGQTRQTSTMPGGVQDRRVEGTLSAARSTGSAIPGFVPPLIPLFIALTSKAVAAPSNVQPGRSLLTLSPVSAGNPPPTHNDLLPPTHPTNKPLPSPVRLAGRCFPGLQRGEQRDGASSGDSSGRSNLFWGGAS